MGASTGAGARCRPFAACVFFLPLPVRMYAVYRVCCGCVCAAAPCIHTGLPAKRRQARPYMLNCGSRGPINYCGTVISRLRGSTRSGLTRTMSGPTSSSLGEISYWSVDASHPTIAPSTPLSRRSSMTPSTT
eukprot:scaffold8405_cov117-Isochrysis_galbana.AAC.2